MMAVVLDCVDHGSGSGSGSGPKSDCLSSAGPGKKPGPSTLLEARAESYAGLPCGC